jgi:hypothetical protein
MMKILCILSVLLLAFALALLGWAYWPLPEAIQTTQYSPNQMQMDLLDRNSVAMPEWRELTLSVPSAIRVGDEARITLHFGPVDGDNGQNLPPNAFEVYNVMLEAQMGLNGAGVQPSGVVSQSLAGGEPVTFEWKVRPLNGAQVSGSMFLRLKFIPKTGGESTERVLAIIPVNIQSKSLWNVNISGLRWVGWIFLVLGGVLATPLVSSGLKIRLEKL